MNTIQRTIDVRVPVTTAYNQWTQFEDFPKFMNGVESIDQIDDKHLHWQVNVGGVEREFDAEITEQHPDDRVAWRSTTGPNHSGAVTFHRIADDVTRVMVQLDWEASGMIESIGAQLDFDERQVEGDLDRFKKFIETRGVETGAWRGDIDRHPDAAGR